MNLHCNNIVLGSEIYTHQYFIYANTLKKRDVFKQIDEYTNSNGKCVGILYGLRRTGKTVLLRQWLFNLPYEERNKSAYITIESNEDFYCIKKDLNELRKNGYKYVVLDEITTCKDFIGGSSALSDNYCSSGMKIFIAGTDSLSLLFAMGEGLYDRNYTLHTTHIPYGEWSRLTNNKSIDDYIKWGGLLHLLPTDGEVRHSAPTWWTAKGIREYFSSSISNNLLNSIRNYKDGDNAGLLSTVLTLSCMESSVYGLFSCSTILEFINILNRVSNIEETLLLSALQSLIETDSHTYDTKVMHRKFRLSDISRMRSAFQNKDDEIYNDLKPILEQLREKAESLLRVKDSIGNYVQPSQFLDIIEYLKNLEVFAMRPALAIPPRNVSEGDLIRYEGINSRLHTQNIVSQPGLRYAQADIMRELIEDNLKFRSFSKEVQNKIINVFMDGVCGIMQKDIVLYETMQNCKKFGGIPLYVNNWLEYNVLPVKAYKALFPRANFDQDKEVDMVIEDKRNGRLLYLIEIKHSSKPFEKQGQWLNNDDVIDRITNGNASIKSKIIIYNGKTMFYNKIYYINIGEYLEMLHYHGIESVMEWFS